MEIQTRLTVASLKRLKTEGGIDLTTDDPQPIIQLKTDPEFVIEVCYYLYKPQFEAANQTQDSFADQCGVEELNLLREEVDQQMRGFSILWQTISTTMQQEMENLQSGNMSDFLKTAMEAQTVPSGPSS